jgi:hypothetical protein
LEKKYIDIKNNEAPSVNTSISTSAGEEETIYGVTHTGHPSTVNRPLLRMIADGNVVPIFKKTKTICNNFNHI